MEDHKFDIKKTVEHWLSRSDIDFETMLHLYNSKDYHWSLFIGHLVIERLLKAGVVKNSGTHAPFTHDLRRLARLSNIEFTEEYNRWFDILSTFNLNARYDDYKQDFYKKCSPKFTEEWIDNIKQLRQWIKKML
ncbi:MAG: HEPN domain-containing protein [Bacteroidetes bacterium]|nr:HEPN domain-containing protein [Bacteroidota bacterium]